MERTELFIYLVIFIGVIILVFKYWKTGKKN